MSDEIKILRDIKSIGYFIDNTEHPESNRLKLADFYYRAKNLQNIISVDEAKKKIIDDLLNRNLNLQDGGYLAGTPISAIKKAEEVLRQINKKEIDLTNYGFINLGGGDGTELFTELENSNSNFGLLMEYDFRMVKKFSDNQIPFRLKNSHRNIETEIIECDLLDKNKFTVAKEIITEKKLNGIIVTIHAVLHELSTRSAFDFDMEIFFKRIFDLHENIIFIIREPGIPENWEEKVYIRVHKDYESTFFEIVERMNEIHFENKEENREKFGDGEIMCISALAIEALTKLFYYKDFAYEKDEKISTMSQNLITQKLQSSKFENIESEAFYTESLEKNMHHYGIKVKGKDNKVISKPQCFTYTIAFKGTHKKIIQNP